MRIFANIRSFACASFLCARYKSFSFANLQQQNEEQAVKLSRKIVSNVDKSCFNLRLYQYQTCPYCCKVRAFLDYFGFSYEVVEVNPVTRSQIDFTDYKKVPIVRIACYHQPLIESSLIISILATFLVRPELSFTDIVQLYPEQVKKDAKTGKEVTEHLNKYFVMWGDTKLDNGQMRDVRDEREWREWVDNHFVHLISPNVYRTLSDSLATFRWFSQVGEWERNFPTWERILAVYVGAAAMWGISKRLKKRHHIVDEREEMREAFDKFMKAKGPDRKFMGGDQPNLADLALFGACNSFFGCVAFSEMCQNDKRLREWFDAMSVAVREARGKGLLEERCKALKAKE
ncbi:Glutaredoxin domain-containing protein [Meloidogyne graminicola]|uniref:Prostaglandin E synthase 2 n=1 Tax=Meloidogyne graminicola TaxID=189291 RepID=A0A8S9ZJB7_9BILA|nr:Glutaredoxin domain-containing protein [Meloidogyne graminicola]